MHRRGSCLENGTTEKEGNDNREHCISEQDDETVVCQKCKHTIDLYEATLFDGIYLCCDCLAFHTFICESCNRLFWLNNGYHSFGADVCESCYAENYEFYLKHGKNKKDNTNVTLTKRKRDVMKKIEIFKLILKAISAVVAIAKALVELIDYIGKLRTSFEKNS